MSRTWRELRDEARRRLGDDQEVRWLVERASGLTASEQVAALEAVADERHEATFLALVERRDAGEPLQYVIGSWGFRTLDLLVDPRALIPRPETEVVAGLAIDALPAEGGRVVDLGTGSGAIALSIAAERWPHVEVWATDASADAIAVARANTAALGRLGGAVRLAVGSWFAALPDDLRGTFDLVVSNPPYVPDGALVARQVRDHEPHLALFGGEEGLDHYREIVAEAPAWLRPGAALVLEIGEDQAAAVVGYAEAAGFTDVQVHQDLTDRDRAVLAR